MKFAVCLLLGTLVLTSCSSRKAAKKDVEERASQSTVTDSKSLGGTIHHLIETSNLTDEKKQELRKIVESNKVRATELSEKSYKYRAVLIEELLSKNMNRRKVKILKKDIKKVESERLKNTFDTVEKISKVVCDHPDKDKFAEQMMLMDRPLR